MKVHGLIGFVKILIFVGLVGAVAAMWASTDVRPPKKRKYQISLVTQGVTLTTKADAIRAAGGCLEVIEYSRVRDVLCFDSMIASEQKDEGPQAQPTMPPAAPLGPLAIPDRQAEQRRSY